MPNINSAKKRLRQDVVKRDRNRALKSALWTSEKKFRALVEANDLEGAAEAYKTVCKRLDKAAKSNTIHKNKVNRKKSRLYTLLKSAEA